MLFNIIQLITIVDSFTAYLLALMQPVVLHLIVQQLYPLRCLVVHLLQWIAAEVYQLQRIGAGLTKFLLKLFPQMLPLCFLRPLVL